MSDEDDAFDAAFGESVNDGTSENEAPQERAEPSGQTEAPQEAETTEEAPPVEPARAENEPPQDKPVPMEQWKGYLDEREKRQEFERRAQELERQLQTLTQKQNTTPQEAPDVFDDPEGYQQFHASQMQQAVMQTKSEMSWFMAEREFGQDAVKEADAWVRQQPPAVFQQLAASPSPYHAAIDAMKRERAMNALKDHDYDIEKLIASRAPQEPVQPTMPEGSRPAIPPAVKPSGTLGKEPSQTEEAVFRSVFSQS